MADDIAEQARETIITRRDALLRERRQLREERQQLAMRDRLIDRELADCRAAARLFNLDIEFPPDEQEEYMRIRSIENRLLHNAARNVPPPVSVSSQASLPLQKENKQPVIVGKLAPNMPRIRDIVLDRLREAGEQGSRATSIKNYIESTYGTELHYKTVGMTLYRLSVEKLVQRKGQTWFFVSPKMGTKNPSASTLGHINRGN